MNSQGIIKIAVADDEELFRKGIIFILGRVKNFQIIHEAANGLELIDYLRKKIETPDIILTDLKMPGLNGIEATKIIRSEFPDIKIIALTSYNTRSFVANMVKIGAAAYLVKNSSPKTVVETIEKVMANGFHYSYETMKTIQEDRIDLNDAESNKEKVSFREKEVLQLICEQLTTQEIADKLKISPRTVEGHRNNLLQKTGSKNIAGLVLFAIQNNLVFIEPIL